MDRLFYVDPENGSCISYSQLMRDVTTMKRATRVLAWEGSFHYFVKLLAGLQRQATMILVDGPKEVSRGEEAWEEICGDKVEQGEGESTWNATSMPSPTPPPQPLSPEYRGEGSKDPFSLCDLALADQCEGSQDFSGRASPGEYKGEWSEVLFKSGKARIGLFTSGTTGKPKLVLHSIESLTRDVRANNRHQADVWGLAYHPTHIAGLQVLFQALANHNPLVRLFDLPVDQVHQTIDSEGITHLSATPTFYNLLCSAGQLHPNVRSVTSGGELSHSSLRERMASTFPNARIHNIYASTEVGTLLISSDDQFQVPTAYEGLVKVIEGELAVHRSLLAASLQANWPDEFYRTGDCVEVLGSSPLTIRFISRHGDWINVGGDKVNPHEVEQALLAMAEVQEAVVYGRDNSVTGSLVCCDIVLTSDAALTAKDIHARLEPLMPRYMIPRIVRCVEEIGATRSGKKERGS